MKHLLMAVALLASWWSGTTLAQTEELVIATKQAPPFVMKNNQGEFEGISIRLFERMAEQQNLTYRFEETDLSGLVDGLAEGRYDASIAAMTVTAEREARIDFSHPFYTTGLAIAVPKDESRLMAAVSGFFSWKFLAALGGLCLLLLGVGLVIWLAERHGNKEEFGGSNAQGIGSGFWWAAVTMTTVGYGDKSPRTFAGRIVGFIWMFAAIILISSFTAAIATSLTVSQLETKVQGVSDLPDVRVTTLAGSASAAFLDSRDIRYKTVDTVQAGLTKMQNGETDALVYDKPILQYRINNGFADDITVLPEEIDRQDYAIGLPENSPLREQFNTGLLKIIDKPEWREQVKEYLGTEE